MRGLWSVLIFTDDSDTSNSSEADELVEAIRVYKMKLIEVLKDPSLVAKLHEVELLIAKDLISPENKSKCPGCLRVLANLLQKLNDQT